MKQGDTVVEAESGRLYSIPYLRPSE